MLRLLSAGKLREERERGPRFGSESFGSRFGGLECC
jgi:hypothetical protein